MRCGGCRARSRRTGGRRPSARLRRRRLSLPARARAPVQLPRGQAACRHGLPPCRRNAATGDVYGRQLPLCRAAAAELADQLELRSIEFPRVGDARALLNGMTSANVRKCMSSWMDGWCAVASGHLRCRRVGPADQQLLRDRCRTAAAHRRERPRSRADHPRPGRVGGVASTVRMRLLTRPCDRPLLQRPTRLAQGPSRSPRGALSRGFRGGGCSMAWAPVRAPRHPRYSSTSTAHSSRCG